MAGFGCSSRSATAVPNRSVWERFAPCLVKGSVPVVQIDLETLVSERLLNYDVCCAIAVHVESRNRQPRFRRKKVDRRVLPGRHVEFDPESLLPIRQPGFQQDRSIWLLIIVEIGSGYVLAKREPDLCAIGASRQRSS